MNNSMMKPFFLLVFLLCSAGAFSQKVALKNNLAYDALKTPNLSLGSPWGINGPLTQGGYEFLFSTRGTPRLPGTRQRSSVTGLSSRSSVIGPVTFSTAGSSGCMPMAAR